MENGSVDQGSAGQGDHYPFLKSFAHIAPGICTFLTFVALKPLVDLWNYPPLMAFTLAVLVVDLPLLLAIMFYQGKKRYGKYSLHSVVQYREKMTWWKFLLVLVLGILLAAMIFMLGASVDHFLSLKLFDWLPAWMRLEDQAQYANYPRSVLLVTIVSWTVITGLVLPVVEEVFFRGYLLPRMIGNNAIYGVTGNALIFTLYHVWQPFGWATIFLLGLLFAGLVYWSRDIKLSMTLHIIGNLQLRLLVLFALL